MKPLILAENASQADMIMQAHSHLRRDEYTVLIEPSDLRGLDRPKVHLLGNFLFRRDWLEWDEALTARLAERDYSVPGELR